MTQSEIHIINYGNMADWFSAIGTVLAVMISLYLIWDEKIIRFKVIAFIQDGTELIERKDSRGYTLVAVRKLLFSGMNSGKQPIAVLYQGLRVKKFFGRRNNIIKVAEVETGDTDIVSPETGMAHNDFELLETGKQTKKRAVDFEVMKKELWEQFPEKKKDVIIEFVYININGDEYTDTLIFKNPKREE